jgi:hypothetical protein
MDTSAKERGATSLRWFLMGHADEVSAELFAALCGGRKIEEQSNADLINRIRELTREQINQLCYAIESIHRSYFGTLNGRELSSFLHTLYDENRAIQL